MSVLRDKIDEWYMFFVPKTYWSTLCALLFSSCPFSLSCRGHPWAGATWQATGDPLGLLHSKSHSLALRLLPGCCIQEYRSENWMSSNLANSYGAGGGGAKEKGSSMAWGGHRADRTWWKNHHGRKSAHLAHVASRVSRTRPFHR